MLQVHLTSEHLLSWSCSWSVPRWFTAVKYNPALFSSEGTLWPLQPCIPHKGRCCIRTIFTIHILFYSTFTSTLQPRECWLLESNYCLPGVQQLFFLTHLIHFRFHLCMSFSLSLLSKFSFKRPNGPNQEDIKQRFHWASFSSLVVVNTVVI